MFGIELYPTPQEKAAALLHSVARHHASSPETSGLPGSRCVSSCGSVR